MERFPFQWAAAYRVAARAFGVTPENAWVEVRETELDARFGRWRMRTPLANVADVEVTGPYRFIKTAGPARLGITDQGLTFATNGDRGVLFSFRQPVRAVLHLRHPELTVTVADVEELAALVRTRVGEATRG